MKLSLLFTLLFLCACENSFSIKKIGSENPLPPPTLTDSNLLKSWQDTVPADVVPTGMMIEFKVNTNENDDALVTWILQTPVTGARKLYRSHYLNRSWTHPSSISDSVNTSGDYVSEVLTAINASGNAVIAWYDAVESKFNVTIYKNGAWTSVMPIIDTLATPVNRMPTKVLFNDNGQIAMVVGYQSTLGVVTYNGVSWASPQSLYFQDSTVVRDFDYSSGMDAQGNILLAFLEINSQNNSALYKATFSNGSWTAPVDVSDSINVNPLTENASTPFVSLSPSGKAAIAWSTDTEQINVRAKTGMTWNLLTPTFTQGTPHTLEKVYITDSGALGLAVKGTFNGSLSQVVKFHSGSSWENEIILDPDAAKFLDIISVSSTFKLMWSNANSETKMTTCTLSACASSVDIGVGSSMESYSTSLTSKRAIFTSSTGTMDENNEYRYYIRGSEIEQNNPKFDLSAIWGDLMPSA